jgi:hypothetical protein
LTSEELVIQKPTSLCPPGRESGARSDRLEDSNRVPPRLPLTDDSDESRAWSVGGEYWLQSLPVPDKWVGTSLDVSLLATVCSRLRPSHVRSVAASHGAREGGRKAEGEDGMTRARGIVLAFVSVVGAGTMAAGPVEQSTVRIEKTADGYWFIEKDTKVLFYQAERKALPDGRAARSNYFHPLYDLDGNVVTEDFPQDHIHHRGIFWAWHQVRIDGKTVQDQWVNRDSFWMVKEAKTDADANSASLALRIEWESPLFIDASGRRRPFVEERSVTRVHRAEGVIRKIDFHQRLTTLVEGVEIGGSEDAKGYGGFSYRVVMPADIRFTGAQGTVTPIENAVAPSPWMDVSGTYGTSGKSGLAVLTHPSTTGFPQPWILRARSSMQNAVYPGRHPVAIPRDRPLILRYQVVLHRGELAPADIERLQAEYARATVPQ